MRDQISVLKTVTQRLAGAGIPHMVSGSIAMNFYAQPRMTRDIDIVVELKPADRALMHGLFSPDFYIDEEDMRESIKRRGIFNIIHSEAMVKVDLVVRKDDPYRKEEFGRRRTITFEGIPLPVVSPEDLLLSKLVWAKDSHSEMQLKDVRNLAASLPDMDWAYIRRWAKELGIESLLDESRGGSQ